MLLGKKVNTITVSNNSIRDRPNVCCVGHHFSMISSEENLEEIRIIERLNGRDWSKH